MQGWKRRLLKQAVGCLQFWALHKLSLKSGNGRQRPQGRKRKAAEKDVVLTAFPGLAAETPIQVTAMAIGASPVSAILDESGPSQGGMAAAMRPPSCRTTCGKLIGRQCPR